MEIPLTRRDFLNFARKNRPQENQPSKKGSSMQAGGGSTPPDGSGWLGTMLTRRKVVVGGATLATGGLGLYVADRLGLISHKPEKPFPETIEGMVAEAREMENSFKDRDLSSKKTRERYAGLIAGIVAVESQGFITRDEILSTIVWTDSLNEFTRERLKDIKNPSFFEPGYRDSAPYVTAITDIRARKMVINTRADAYSQENLSGMRTSVKLNPLTMLRMSLVHEFHHLVKTGVDEELFAMIDPRNELLDKMIEGFRFRADHPSGSPAGALNNIHEAMFELASKDINQRYFGFFFSDYGTSQDSQSLTSVMNGLERVLQATGITIQEAKVLQRESRLRDFLLLVLSRGGVSDQDSVSARLKFGLTLMTAIERNDRAFVQGFINRATNYRQRKIN